MGGVAVNFKTKEIAAVLQVENLEIDPETLGLIRRLSDFDLAMLLSEIHDHGWHVANKLIPMMLLADDARGRAR